MTFNPTPEKVAEHLRWKEEDLAEATVIERYLSEQMDGAERRRWKAEHDLSHFKETIARFVGCQLLCTRRAA